MRDSVKWVCGRQRTVCFTDCLCLVSRECDETVARVTVLNGIVGVDGHFVVTG